MREGSCLSSLKLLFFFGIQVLLSLNSTNLSPNCKPHVTIPSRESFLASLFHQLPPPPQSTYSTTSSISSTISIRLTKLETTYLNFLLLLCTSSPPAPPSHGPPLSSPPFSLVHLPLVHLLLVHLLLLLLLVEGERPGVGALHLLQGVKPDPQPHCPFLRLPADMKR